MTMPNNPGDVLMSTLSAVITRMQTLIDAWETSNDHRAVFLSCYAMMTRNMFVALDKQAFRDASWVSTLLHQFAGYYFEAVDTYDDTTSCSTVWRFAFDAARKPDTHVIQNLMLGVNAHINYDLVLALVDILQEEWADLSPEQRAARYYDHCHVNTIIAATINSVQDQVIERYNPAMDIVDKLFGPLDEWLIAKLVANWREEVWQHAGELMACTNTTEIAQHRQQVEHHTMTRAQVIAGKRDIAGILELV
jgi:hypothetical protein